MEAAFEEAMWMRQCFKRPEKTPLLLLRDMEAAGLAGTAGILRSRILFL
jgi:hypothetical protein